MSTAAEDSKNSSSGEDESKKKDDDDSDEIVEIPVIKPDGQQAKSSRHFKESILSDEMKFMQDFDEKNSLRRQRKNRRQRFYADGRPIINADDYDDCDCLRPNCPGCHYPCPRCEDRRCGKECRTGRRWLYETIETEGTTKVLKNRHIDSFGYQEYD